MIARISEEDGLVIYSLLCMLASKKRYFIVVDAGAGIEYSSSNLYAVKKKIKKDLAFLRLH